jgi:hypothetical protein
MMQSERDFDVWNNMAPHRLTTKCTTTKRHGKPKVSRRPVLRVEDDYDLSCRPDEDQELGEVPVDSEEEVLSEDDERTDSKNETLSLASSFTMPSIDGLIGQMLSHTSVDDGATEDNLIEGDEWIDEFSLASAFSLLEVSSTTDDGMSNWEMVSEDNSSVLDGQKKSYREALRCGDAPSMTTLPKLKPKGGQSQNSRSLKKITEEEPSEDFDSSFIMEGVKKSRGGKAALQFKGNQKTPFWLPRHLRTPSRRERKGW